jgi:hypothetical protein
VTSPGPEPVTGVENGIRELVAGLEPGQGQLVAVFDTRVARSRLLTGSAAHALAHFLKRHGYHLVAEPESFLVETAPEGAPHERLRPGELERAGAWAKAVVEAARTSAPVAPVAHS